MAFGTNLNVNVLLGRTSYKFIATVANYLCLIIGWMDSLSHDFHLSILIVRFPTAKMRCRILLHFMLYAQPSKYIIENQGLQALFRQETEAAPAKEPF
jgi:hypothetical protein